MQLKIRRLEELEVFDGLRLSVVVAAEALTEIAAEAVAEAVAGLGYRSGGLDTN